ncbi:hypothetical protein QOZ80_2BG0202710 [Eleusine coracana subsp. coracana]|nr:hypothetical protein QOZ80_2BG0202710 [Eleusine coracana subsp. coracana]
MSGEMARAEVLPEGAAPGSGVDLFEQATKALALRTPFDGDEVPPRNPTLPTRLVSWSGLEDYRKKHKKAPPPPDATAAKRPPESAVSRPTKAGLWGQFEAYFRPVTLDDLEMLRPNFPFSGSKVDSSMLIPFLGSSEELMNEVQTFDVAVAETSSYLGVGGEEVISNRDRSEIHQKERSNQCTGQDIHDVVVQQLVSDKELTRQSREQGIHEVSVQLGERPFEAFEAGRSSGIVFTQCAEEEDTSLNWLLGAKGRFVLTSERPNKKRKLLGVDAGLEQLVLLPCMGPEASSCCDVCCLGENSIESNKIVNCSKCKVSVHPKCYGLHAVPEGQWLCAWCTYLESTGSLSKDADGTQSMPCVLCPKEKGALKPVKVEPIQNACVGPAKFVHLFCSLWSPEVFVEDMESMEPVTNLGNVQENRMKLTCSICKIKHGACVRCSHGTCRTPFHPICARESKHQMEIWGKFGHPNVELRAFCLKHSAVGSINSVVKNNNASEQSALPHMVRDANGQPIQTWKTDAVHSFVAGDHIRSSGDIAAVLRKLIDSGNVSVGDIASEVGISSESLEAALVGETTTFSHGLKLKIIKWLQNYEHIHADQGSALKGTPGAGQDDKPDGSEATQTVEMNSSMVSNDDKGAPVDVSGSAVIEPSLTRSKCNNKVLKDKNITSTTDVTILQNGNKNIFKEGPNLECSPAGESEFSRIDSKDVLKEEHGKLILNTTSGNKEFGTSMDIPNENRDSCILLGIGPLLGAKSSDLSEADRGSGLDEGASSLGHCFSLGDKAKTGMKSVENGIGTCDCDSDCFHEQLFFNFDDSRSYIHPFIKNKMAHHTLKQDSEASCHHDPSQGETSVESSLKLEDTIETTAADQVLDARSLKILEHSPDDEVEGEIVYLQARLLDNAVVLKHRYEKLLAKVVHNLSQELDAFNKRNWDLIFVNQFLRDVREAKKRGRKEKRHKEAQAVLAAAAAAVASSSRNSNLRKDVKEPANQEDSPKLATGSSRAGPWQAKDSSKLSNSKVSTENNFWSFHMPISSKENPLYCDICMRTETVLNRIFVCSRCKAAVHIDCYKNLDNSVGPWTCEFCEDVSSEAGTITDQSDCNGMKLPFAQCSMCHGTSGAFRKTTDGQWVHAFCAEWLLGTKYMRGQDNLVHGMESLEEGKDTCCVCLCNVGMCLRCNSGDCHVTFHPTCARNSGFYMNTKGFGTTPEHKAYCGKHSVEQKEVDAQQYGPEELKSMKLMRVELEKLRLLCERIIKREKVKRETVLCDHDILAKTKDTVVFSYLASGASSESATTSVNNKSYSGTMQRSDDVTVDSTISGKKTIRFSLNSRDAERNTADSSRTLISFKRKLGERGSLAGKQLPYRPATTSQKLEDGGKKTKDKKGTFQKELVMTSDQASTQNQRLPKGYAYVPRDSLSKEKPWNRNAQAQNPQEPGG